MNWLAFRIIKWIWEALVTFQRINRLIASFPMLYIRKWWIVEDFYMLFTLTGGCAVIRTRYLFQSEHVWELWRYRNEYQADGGWVSAGCKKQPKYSDHRFVWCKIKFFSYTYLVNHGSYSWLRPIVKPLEHYGFCRRHGQICWKLSGV